MGNDHGKFKDLEIDRNSPVLTTDTFVLFNAEDSNKKISIFLENNNLFERARKNLMILRHPYILKYITSFNLGSQKLLATERINTVKSILATATDIQICLGLRNILSSLIFLIEQARVRHLNVCISSIYITPSGEWRLFGFEHVWKSKDLTNDVVESAKSIRYQPAIDPYDNRNSTENLEQWAFGVLCEEILKNVTDTPYIIEFREYCTAHLKNKNIQMRPTLSAILLHPYFNHEFVMIHSFLTELPLKTLQEKQNFFSILIDRLKYFDENIVASQIGRLLLSRMVFLDETAQNCVLPYVLKPKADEIIGETSLFSEAIFSKFIVPHLKKIFGVRDVQIRLILLEYFPEYCHSMTKEELKEEILPNILLGIKDTDDILVAKTLHILALLIPILGSSVVIGANRTKLFADGRPNTIQDNFRLHEPRSITPVLNPEDFHNNLIVSASPAPPDLSEDSKESNFMPERLSPDGGECEENNIKPNNNDDDTEWSDWDNNNDELKSLFIDSSLNLESKQIPPKNIPQTRPKIVDDITDLDIKIKNPTNKTENKKEFDFFKDMEPVIETKTLEDLLKSDLEINENQMKENDIVIDKSRFELRLKEEENSTEAGWDDAAISDWGE